MIEIKYKKEKIKRGNAIQGKELRYFTFHVLQLEENGVRDMNFIIKNHPIHDLRNEKEDCTHKEDCFPFFQLAVINLPPPIYVLYDIYSELYGFFSTS